MQPSPKLATGAQTASSSLPGGDNCPPEPYTRASASRHARMGQSTTSMHSTSHDDGRVVTECVDDRVGLTEIGLANQFAPDSRLGASGVVLGPRPLGASNARLDPDPRVAALVKNRQGLLNARLRATRSGGPSGLVRLPNGRARRRAPW